MITCIASVIDHIINSTARSDFLQMSVNYLANACESWTFKMELARLGSLSFPPKYMKKNTKQASMTVSVTFQQQH